MRHPLRRWKVHAVSGVVVLLALACSHLTTRAPSSSQDVIIADAVERRKNQAIGVEELWYRAGSDWKFCCELETLPSGIPLHHWAPVPVADRWEATGRVESSEMDYLIENGTGVAGGGIYVSLDPLDSFYYGPRLVVFTPPEAMTWIVVKAGHNQKSYPKIQVPSRAVTTPAPSPSPFVSPLASASPVPVSSPSPSVGPADPFDFSLVIPPALLRAVGVHGVKYTPTWAVLYDPMPVSKLHEGAAHDLIASLPLDYPRLLQGLLQFNTRYPLVSGEELKTKFPTIDLILKSAPEALEKGKAIFDAYLLQAGVTMLASAPGSPLTEGLKSVFHQRLIEFSMSQIKPMTSHPENEESCVRSLNTAWYSGVQPEELFPGFVHYSRTDLLKVPYSNVAYPSSQFGKRLMDAFKIAHPYEIALAIAEGQASPEIYFDLRSPVPLLAIDKALNGVVPMPPGTTYDEALYTLYTGKPKREFRKLPLMRGGSVFLDGPGTDGYRLITEHQKMNLEQNPLLLAEFKPGPDPETFYAKYRLPVAKDFERFPTLLTAAELAELQAAHTVGTMADPLSADAQVLTAHLLKDLSRPGSDPNFRDQRMLEIEPLLEADQPGLLERTYQKINVSDPGLVPYLSLAETFWEVLIRRQAYLVMASVINTEELANPSFPKFYDLPGLWQVILEVDALPVDLPAFVKAAQSFFKDPEIKSLILARNFREVRLRILKSFPL